ncbi:hypothetical protein [Celerinatantimonas sp. MCCC 1A17872]|uniref:hypothetical protein n=1 Tax=Celerinatantimonas sp. MCCC 1A17872 TaxID=3177514 RepID=UPI0038C534B6
MSINIVTKVREQFFDGSFVNAASHFHVSSTAYRKWEQSGEFPAKNGRMQQAHELTHFDYQILTPSAFCLPSNSQAT